MGFSGLLFLKRSVGALNQLLRGYFLLQLDLCQESHLCSKPGAVDIREHEGSRNKMLFPSRDQQTQAGKYATEICGMS